MPTPKTPIPLLKALRETRKRNLLALAGQYGGNTKLGRALGYSNGAYLTQLIGKRPRRSISETTARRVEMKLRLPPGWLDDPMSQA